MTDTGTERRERSTLRAAVWLSGPAEVVDFLLPLYAGLVLDADATLIGILIGVELAVSLIVRPIAGQLADRHERRTLAATGALVYALACGGYALAASIEGGLAVAFVASAVSGAGGALLWVSVRAIVGERIGADSSVFARLVSAEELGGWVIFPPAVWVASAVSYEVAFGLLAGCALVGAAVLLTTPRQERKVDAVVDPASDQQHGMLRRLAPMLAAVVTTEAAESVIGLLLLLHLQDEYDLEPIGVAVVFLPGAIAMSVLPTHLHGLVLRFGRARMLAAASVASAGFAAGLAFAPNPWVIALLWVLSAAAWALVLPVQQAVIAEASGQSHLGRGLGWYEASALAGALVGVVVGGVLYDVGSWTIACLCAAAVILSGAVIVPAGVRALGVVDVPAADQDTGGEEDRLPLR